MSIAIDPDYEGWSGVARIRSAYTSGVWMRVACIDIGRAKCFYGDEDLRKPDGKPELTAEPMRPRRPKAKNAAPAKATKAQSLSDRIYAYLKAHGRASTPKIVDSIRTPEETRSLLIIQVGSTCRRAHRIKSVMGGNNKMWEAI